MKLQVMKRSSYWLLGVNKIADWNSKLCVWHSGGHVENPQNTFLNQALNTLNNYGTRALINVLNTWDFNVNNSKFNYNGKITVQDARSISDQCDIWITDPPYADAVNYHELSEFFLAWDTSLLKDYFQNNDSKKSFSC